MPATIGTPARWAGRDVVAVRGRDLLRALEGVAEQASGRGVLEDELDDGERGHKEGAALEHLGDELLGEVGAVLDGVDASADGVGERARAVGVRGEGLRGAVGLGGGDAHLVLAELHGVGAEPGPDDPARGHELDQVGAGLELLAHGAAHGVGAVGLAPDGPAVAAGGGKPVPGGVDARPAGVAVVEGVAEPEDDRRDAADVARGRHAVREQPLGAMRCAERLVGVRPRVGVLERARGGVEAEVGVGVDEAGDRRGAGGVEQRLVAVEAGADLDEAAVAHAHVDAREHLAGAVDQAQVADQHGALPSSDLLEPGRSEHTRGSRARPGQARVAWAGRWSRAPAALRSSARGGSHGRYP